MNTIGLLFEGAWHVLLAGLILGAGLPAIFALGIRSLSWGAIGADEDPSHQPHLLGKVVGFTCFAVVLAAVGLGIGIIVASGFGLEVVFGWPMFVRA